jgi:ABC-2 type transport system permease protein
MNAFLRLTVSQFRAMMRNKVAFFFNLVMPLLFLGFFGLMYGPKEANLPVVGLVDLDRGPGAAQLRDYLTKHGPFQVREGSESDLLTQLTKGKVDVVLLLQQGLSDQLAAQHGPALVTVKYDQDSQVSGMAVGTVAAVLNTYGTQPVIIAQPTAVTNQPKLNVVDYMMSGELTQMLLTAGLVTVAIWLASQRHTSALRHLFSTPLSMRTWVASRILANLVMAVLQILILYGVSYALFRVQGPANLPGTILFLFISALATLGLGLFVGVLAPSPEAALPMSMIPYMGLAFLGGAMMPIQQGPAILLQIAKFVPTYYMTEGLRLVMVLGKPLSEVWLNLLIIGATALVTISFATWRIRKQFVQA